MREHLPAILHSLTLGASAWVVMLALEFVSTGHLQLREAYVWASLGIAAAAWLQLTRRSDSGPDSGACRSQTESRSR
ncbi:MAG: hypothetical protein D6758_10495 [Gammaproteobacteria bacterium]|nr:MAG: hypothetical protein D6758_10495 [Gammaproteobacteria bacterium]